MHIEGLSLAFVGFCGVMGVAGQLIRSVIGFYKVWKNPTVDTKATWNWWWFLLTLGVGLIIGLVMSLFYNNPPSKQDILGIIAASYGGTDFLEGFLRGRGDAIK